MNIVKAMASYQKRYGLKPIGPHRPLADKLEGQGMSPKSLRATVLLQFPDAGASSDIDPNGDIYHDLLKGVIVSLDDDEFTSI